MGPKGSTSYSSVFSPLNPNMGSLWPRVIRIERLFFIQINSNILSTCFYIAMDCIGHINLALIFVVWLTGAVYF